MDDLNLAIEASYGALQLIQADDPRRTAFLHVLGKALEQKLEQTGALEDLEKCVDAYKESASLPQCLARMRIASARQGANLVRRHDPARPLIYWRSA